MPYPEDPHPLHPSLYDEYEREAAAELEQEERRAKIDAAKARIRERNGRSFWQRLLPYKITIERR